MKFIVNNKIYDTDTSEEICKFKKAMPIKNLLGTIYPMFRCTLYKSKKGQFFYYIGEAVGTVTYSDYNEIRLLTETETKELLTKLNDVETFNKLFNDLEEG